MVKKALLFGITGLSFGILIGFLIILFLSKLPLPPDHQIYKFLGIGKKRIIGFQPYWLLQKADKNYLPYLTTYTYFGLTLDSDGTIFKLSNPREEEPGWTTIRGSELNMRLKQAEADHLNFSLLLHNSDEASISILLQNPEKHARNLITDVAPIMKKYGFTDLNLDLESFAEATEGSRLQFISFVREVKRGLMQNKLGTLTLEISPTVLVKKFVINPEEIGKIADYIVLMAYDYHYSGSYLAGPVSPLGGAGKVREYDVEKSLQEALKIIPAKKLILGIPLYGYEWETLSDKPGAAVIPGTGATASNRRATQLLTECQNCISSPDELSKEPYIIFPDPAENYYHQIFYEDEKSLAYKIELAKKYDIGGTALWALGYEGDKMLEPLKDYKRTVEF